MLIEIRGNFFSASADYSAPEKKRNFHTKLHIIIILYFKITASLKEVTVEKTITEK